MDFRTLVFFMSVVFFTLFIIYSIFKDCACANNQTESDDTSAKTPKKEDNIKEIDNTTITNHYFDLLSIFLAEWSHRDDLMWKELFTYFYAALVVIIVPYTNIVSSSNASWVQTGGFIAGFVLTICVIMVGTSYGERLSRVGDAYRHLIKKLPEDYRKGYLIQEEIKEPDYRKWYLAIVIPYVMGFILFILNCVLYLSSINLNTVL